MQSGRSWRPSREHTCQTTGKYRLHSVAKVHVFFITANFQAKFFFKVLLCLQNKIV
jgi:hypothetical protein